MQKKVDTVAVYIVDHLIRSVIDFAKLAELLYVHGMSFVSVTLAFNHYQEHESAKGCQAKKLVVI
jgi:DNA invertase Pin-like site-specific DNA recombinase